MLSFSHQKDGRYSYKKMFLYMREYFVSCAAKQPTCEELGVYLQIELWYGVNSLMSNNIFWLAWR